MSEKQAKPARFIGLDVHKHYLVAVGVNPEREVVYGPRRVALAQLAAWRNNTLTKEDAVVLEMSTNSYELHDRLLAQVHSVTIVHPPHVKLITQAQVKTDRKAAHNLAVLHAVGLLKGVWVPDQAGRDLRAVVAQRAKLVKLATQAKNRLQAVLHRLHLGLPPSGGLFTPENRAWWLQLPLSKLAAVRLRSDLATLDFAQAQIKRLEAVLIEAAGEDERMPLLIQLPGIGLISAITLLAAIGPIERFSEPAQLVGYAGLGDEFTTAANCCGAAASPNRGGATSGLPQLKQPILRSGFIPTGEPSSNALSPAWGPAKRLWPLRVNCWWPSGTS